MEYRKNTAYIFLPCMISRPLDFQTLTGRLNCGRSWELVHDEITYMLKYVADKINSRDEKNCQCFHYVLNDEGRKEAGLPGRECWFATRAHDYHGQKEQFRFQILSVQLYCFRTSVCIAAYQIHLEKDDPMWVSTAEYYLKKVSREAVAPDRPGGEPFTLLDLSKRLMERLGGGEQFRFFYYANPSTERANVLTYLEVEAKDDYRRELFYLRRCYSEGFLYTGDELQSAEEIYMPSRDITWGISPEAAVCLACPEHGNETFIREAFARNFNAQYLFMYILLLHQKYVLYMFLTRIGVGTYNNLEMLEEYRGQLYEFETDFVFSCVTEVPQYQNLYERMTQAFSLKQMYEDVREPLQSLSEVRLARSEKAQKRRDDDVNRALLILSILSFFSALVDSFDFIDKFFGWFLDANGVMAVQVVCIVLIDLLAVAVAVSLLRSRKH